MVIKERTIRLAATADITEILLIFEDAREKMRATGNHNQWIAGYPSAAVVARDIEKGGGYVIVERGTIIGYFAFLPSPEPTYAKIYEGQWLDSERPYYVVHRLASRKGVTGIFATMMRYCEAQTSNLRLDTHRQNSVMIHNIKKHGFEYCGIIYLENGDSRLAYQRILKGGRE